MSEEKIFLEGEEGPAAIAKRARRAARALVVFPSEKKNSTLLAVADEIGVLTKARATVLLVGERPGLGTGDSLSVYIAVNPKLGQDNAEKNCISNVRPMGILPPEAARQTVEILRRAFQAGKGGVASK